MGAGGSVGISAAATIIRAFVHLVDSLQRGPWLSPHRHPYPRILRENQCDSFLFDRFVFHVAQCMIPTSSIPPPLIVLLFLVCEDKKYL